jgi:putative membrane protein
MKLNMKVASAIVAALTASPAAWAQDSVPTDPDRQTSIDQMVSPPPANPDTDIAAQPGARLASSELDQTFVQESLQSGRFEVEAAKLAQQRSKDANVRDLAKMLESDHLALNRQLEALGGTNIGDTEKQLALDAQMDELKALEGQPFDEAYLSMQRDGHAKSIARFQSVAADTAHSAAVRDLATATLPKLRHHEAMVSTRYDAVAAQGY